MLNVANQMKMTSGEEALVWVLSNPRCPLLILFWLTKNKQAKTPKT